MRRARPASRRGARSRPRALVALCLGLLLVLPGVAAAGSVGPATDELVVEITEISPAVLRPGDDLTVRGTVANPSDDDVPTAEMRLRMQYSTPISRSMLDRWLDPASGSATHLLAEEEVGVVPAGASRAFAVTLPADELPLSESAAAWGPRGIEVEVIDGDRRTGTDRSFAVWYPDVAVEPTTISVLVPVVPTAGELAQDRDVASASAPRLTALVD
ncbi:DUF6049 family protein, partial [Georgenia sp. 10Sc9-8]|nr:DUF6049 family protein [Georgenia halotolerans]